MGELKDMKWTRWADKRPEKEGWYIVKLASEELLYLVLYYVPNFARPDAGWSWESRTVVLTPGTRVTSYLGPIELPPEEVDPMEFLSIGEIKARLEASFNKQCIENNWSVEQQVNNWGMLTRMWPWGGT